MPAVVIRLCALVALLLAGCQGVERSDFLPPRVTLADLRLIGSNLIEQEFQLRLRIVNANNYQLSLSGLRYNLRLNERDFLEGVSNGTVTVPRLSETTVLARGRTNTIELVDQVLTIVEAKEFRYALEGVAYIDGGPVAGVPFNAGGDIRLTPPFGRSFEPLR
jgi:LEA14-like dessication related protein